MKNHPRKQSFVFVIQLFDFKCDRELLCVPFAFSCCHHRQNILGIFFLDDVFKTSTIPPPLSAPLLLSHSFSFSLLSPCFLLCAVSLSLFSFPLGSLFGPPRSPLPLLSSSLSLSPSLCPSFSP
ncbi:hypothetical protein NQD34_004935 [Periophthalmus magnuspinnatus]|nr:hypothetical protein NQD34_004935 [Periophthalmus magnuspinnatus]